jgi:hypothetical protein
MKYRNDYLDEIYKLAQTPTSDIIDSEFNRAMKSSINPNLSYSARNPAIHTQAPLYNTNQAFKPPSQSKQKVDKYSIDVPNQNVDNGNSSLNYDFKDIDYKDTTPVSWNFDNNAIEKYKSKWKFVVPANKFRSDEINNLKYTQPITQKFYYDFKNYMAKKGIDIKIGHQGGFRDLATQKAILKRGATKTLKSHHREGRALDIVVANYDPRHDKKFWGANSKIAKEMRKFAKSHPTYSKYVRFLSPKWDPNHIEFRTPRYWARHKR